MFIDGSRSRGKGNSTSLSRMGAHGYCLFVIYDPSQAGRQLQVRQGSLGDAPRVHPGLKGFVTLAGAQQEGQLQHRQPNCGAPVCLRRLNASRGPASPAWV